MPGFYDNNNSYYAGHFAAFHKASTKLLAEVFVERV